MKYLFHVKNLESLENYGIMSMLVSLFALFFVVDKT